MKLLLFVIVAAISAPALADTAQDKSADSKPATVGQLFAPAGAGYARSNGQLWYHMADGRWFLWTPGQWVPKTGQGGAAATPNRTARTTYYRSEVVSYPDDDSRNVYWGIDWYLNGRGPFSD